MGAEERDIQEALKNMQNSPSKSNSPPKSNTKTLQQMLDERWIGQKVGNGVFGKGYLANLNARQVRLEEHNRGAFRLLSCKWSKKETNYKQTGSSILINENTKLDRPEHKSLFGLIIETSGEPLPWKLYFKKKATRDRLMITLQAIVERKKSVAST